MKKSFIYGRPGEVCRSVNSRNTDAQTRWRSDIDIIEARKFDDFSSINIHYDGNNQGGAECYESNHTDEPVPGLHEQFYTLGCRWFDKMSLHTLTI